MAYRSKVPGKLRRARKHVHYIEIVRDIKRADWLQGYVVAVGRRWVLLAAPSDGSPAGYVAVRVRDIERIYWASGGRFVRRSLAAQAAWPPVRPDAPIDLDGGVKKLVESVAAASALVTIFRERFAPDVCYIGRPIRWGRRKLRLQAVSPDGCWTGVGKYGIKTITRVDFGGVYETNLAVVAGDPPSLGALSAGP